jgi:lambda repressor-like predicted transcriptional regulator
MASQDVLAIRWLMENVRLRAVMRERGVSAAALAKAAEVSPKTVERWVTTGRPPYPQSQDTVARYLGVKVANLWPDESAHSTYAERDAVPRAEWDRLFSTAESEIGILTYAGGFLLGDAEVRDLLAERARAGVRVRIMLGDPDGEEVARCGVELAGEIRDVCRALRGLEGVEIRLHRTFLYSSIFCADDELLVNLYVYGVTEARSPVINLFKPAGDDMADTYLECFDRIWERATPL